MPMCCVELTRRAHLIKPLCSFGRPANERKSTTCGILQDNELAIPRGGVNCLAHEYPALDAVWRRSTSRGLAFSSLSWSVKTWVRRSSIPVVLKKWRCLVLFRQQ